MNLTDVLVETALQDIKNKLYEGTLEDFQAMFNSITNSYISKGPSDEISLVEDVWNALQSYGRDGFAVEAAFAPVVYAKSHVIVSVVCENSDPIEPVFFNSGGPRSLENGYEVEFSCPVVDSIGIYVMAPNRPVLRFVDLLVKSAILSNTKWFIDMGASGPIWASSSDLAPVTAMVGKETVLKYVRKQTWNFHTQLAIRPFGGRVVTPKHILVHAAGTFVSKVPNPETRTVTELDGTTQGKVTPVMGDES